MIILVTDGVYKHGCTVPRVPPGLEIRHGHDLLDLDTVEQVAHSTTLLARCQDITAAMTGSPMTECQDGVWSHSLPSCRRTAGPGQYSGVPGILTTC